tara:strand:+ start:177 stop:785 length:609 start_codon:yes stop_codon:yes gene_type:complete
MQVQDDICKKTFLLVGSSRSLLNRSFTKKKVDVDYTCRFGFRWMEKSDELTRYMGDFNAVISSHYDHKNVIDQYYKNEIGKKTKRIFLVSPQKERYVIEKDDNISYHDITPDEYQKIADAYQRYGFTKFPRTGLTCIIWLIFAKECKVFIRGFDIDASDNSTDQDISVKNKKLCCRHNSKAESRVINQLIAEKYIHVYDELP